MGISSGMTTIWHAWANKDTNSKWKEILLNLLMKLDWKRFNCSGKMCEES